MRAQKLRQTLTYIVGCAFHTKVVELEDQYGLCDEVQLHIIVDVTQSRFAFFSLLTQSPS